MGIFLFNSWNIDATTQNGLRLSRLFSYIRGYIGSDKILGDPPIRNVIFINPKEDDDF